MDYKNEIGRRIRQARENRGLTLAELSRLTGDRLDLKRINAYENGVRMPRPAEVEILADVLGVRAAFLIALEDAMEEKLLRNWRALSERDRMEVFRHVEALALTARDPVPDQVVARHLPLPKPAPKAPVKRAKR